MVILPLDYRTFGHALRIARRAARGNSAEGLSLLRELLAVLVNSNQVLAAVEFWVALGSRYSAPADISAYSKKLPDIIERLAASGFATEAVRVMATGVGLDPAMGGQLVQSARSAFARGGRRIISQTSRVAANDLAGVGMGVLRAGNPEGIVLMGAAHSVAPEIKIPIEEIAANLHNIPQRQPTYLELDEAQALIQAAYDLRFSGRKDPAVRLGALVPAMVPGTGMDRLISDLESGAKPESAKAFQTSREILSKGFAAEATNLLVDTGSVSPDDMWASVNKEIGGPSQELKQPSVTSYALRSVRSKVVDSDQGPPPGPSFFFELKGDDARCDEVLWGKAFDLVFRYDVLPENVVGGVKGGGFETVVRGDAELGVEVIPKGLMLRDGGAFRLVQFKDGKMVGDPPTFHLQAPEKDADEEAEPWGAYVSFTIAGATIYSFFLPIQVVDKLATGPCVKPIFDLDLPEIASTKVDMPRAAWLTIRKKGGPYQVFGGLYPPAHGDLLPDDTLTVTEASLDAAYNDGIRDDFKAIAGDVAWRFVDDKLQLPAEQADAALACMKKTMTAGFRLYRRFAADPVFKKALDLIDNLPDGSRITIKTDKAVYPWELIYPLHYIDGDKPENFKPEKFWGNRFLIESLVLPPPPPKGDNAPMQRRQRGKLYVSMGVNSGIDNDPPWNSRPPPGPVKLQKDYFDTELKTRGGYFDQYAQIYDIIYKADPASLIYFFCHGTATALEFDKHKPKFTADNVEGNPIYPGGPIVFVNACDAADISPLSLSSFRDEFRKRNAAGLIAPSFAIPTLFAAVFANSFLASYVDRQPIGSILFNLRRELLAKNNPLGLWYSLQCPLDVKAPEH